MQTRILSGTQAINGMSLASILNTIKTKTPKVSHILLLPSIASFRAVANLIFRANILGLATLLQFMFDKRPDLKTKFIERWYALGGEQTGSTVIASIKTGSAKRGILSIAKLINRINHARSQNTNIPIGCIKCNSRCNNPQIGSIGATGVEEASASATILVIIDFLTQAIDIWKQFKPNEDSDSPDEYDGNNQKDNGNDGPGKKSDNSNILIFGGLGLAAFLLLQNK